MRLTKDRESGVYHARVTTPHGPRTLSTKATDIKQARRVVRDSKLQEIEDAAKAGRLTSQAIGMILAGRKVTIATAIVQFAEWQRTFGRSDNTLTNTLSFLNAWARDMKLLGIPPAAITEKHIGPWVNDPESKSKAGSRAVQLSAVRSFFSYCSAKGWTAGDPSRLVRVDMRLLTHEQKEPKVRECFTDTEIGQLFAAHRPGTFWHSAIVIGRWTGLRLGDICQLQWECFSKPGKLAVWTDKKDRRVELPIEPLALQEAIAAIPRQDKTYCFPAERAAIIDPRRRSIFSTQFRRMAAPLGIKGKTFHCLRHTFVTECDRQGIPIEHISRSVGHSNSATTRGYIH